MPKRKLGIVTVVLAVLVAAVVVASIALADTPPSESQPTTTEQGPTRAELRLIKKKQTTLRKRIDNRRHATWRCQDVTFTRHSGKKGRPEKHIENLQHLRKASVRWAKKQKRACHKAHNPPHEPQWLCIHSHEGAWDDPNAPYWGGLQMDVDFMKAYGGKLYYMKGTADNWTPHEQMWTAERALPTRGFGPWPNTARMCGLL